MNPTWIIIAVALIAAAMGARLGGRRLAAGAVGTAVGAALVPLAGPAIAREIAARTPWSVWTTEVAGWTIGYVLISSAVTLLAIRLLGRGAPAGTPSRAGRLFGALVGCSAGGFCAWLAVGNLADVVVDSLPAEGSQTVAAIRRPFEIVRACRVLANISDDEAEMLVKHRDIRAVLEADSLERLLRTPGVIRKVSRAVEGDWGELAMLAADPAVKDAMSEPDFLQRVRAVDVVALAADVERCRAGEPPPAIEAGNANLPRLANLSEWERRLAEDAELRELVAAEWPAGERGHSPQSRVPRPRTRDEVVADYWRGVSNLLELADGPNVPMSWLPGFDLPTPPPVKPDEPLIREEPIRADALP
jgi:hypothetical protein